MTPPEEIRANGRVYYAMKDAPKDRPIWLIFRDAMGVYQSLVPYRWQTDRSPAGWVSSSTGLAPSPAIVGWTDKDERQHHEDGA